MADILLVLEIKGLKMGDELLKQVLSSLKGPQTDFSLVAKEVKCYFR